MFGSDILDVVIAMAFIYFLLSIVASALQETVSQIVKWRSRTLRSGIGELLGDPTVSGLAKKVYEHPLVKSLGTEGSNPSYLKDTTFADALMESVSTAETALDTTIQTVKDGVAALPDGAAKTQLQVLLRESGDELNSLQTNIAAWFDNGMDRLTGVYTRYARTVLIVVGFGLAVVFNVDSIATAEALLTNPSSRDVIVAQAVALTDEGELATPPEKAIKELNGIQLGIGWSICWYEKEAEADGSDTDATPCGKNQAGAWPTLEAWFTYGIGRLPGWLFTAFAVALGAPFWFDTLKNLANLRAAGTKPKKTDA